MSLTIILDCIMTFLALPQMMPPAVDSGLCATVLTQVSDVEDETNRLFTYDRQILKIKENALKNIFLKIEERFKA